MTTLQEQFERDYPDKSARKIWAQSKYENSNFTNYDLDLREYRELEEIELNGNKLASLDISECRELNELYLSDSKLIFIDLYQNKKLVSLWIFRSNLISMDLSECKELKRLELGINNLTSVDFLNTIPNPKKLENLAIWSNKIQPTDIEFFSKFVNLDTLKIGTTVSVTEEGDSFISSKNKFYGSFKSWKNLTKLGSICIEATDVGEGLEYLPMSLARSTSYEAKREREDYEKKKEKDGYARIECSPHNTEAKCSQIQDQLRPFNYDLEAWQLAHPELMLKSRPEYFAQEGSKEKWIKALTTKIEQTKQELQETKTNLPDKVKRIQRLTSKLASLENIKNLLEELDIEKEHSKDINNWYQRQLEGENAQKRNNLFNLFLELKWENNQQEQENKKLKENMEIMKKLAEQEITELKRKITQLENQQNQQTVPQQTNNN